LGYAASVEVWEQAPNVAGKRLVGGLYGVTLRKAFFGESMFSVVPNASKLALIHLAKAMETVGGRFIDCQFETALFKSMGGRHITYDDYMNLLLETGVDAQVQQGVDDNIGDQNPSS
jgi:leucyl/phenylalanyl-tRNA--protein transferase